MIDNDNKNKDEHDDTVSNNKSKYETDFINDVHKKKCLMHLYIPTKLKKTKRIIAIGDLHGDFDLAIKSLQIARVISVENNKIKWIGGNTIVVQTGDQLDSARDNCKCNKNQKQTRIMSVSNKNECLECNQTETHDNKKKSCDIHVFKLFTKLHFAAMKHGGQVISLLGNHEVQNVLGLMDSYVSQNDIEYFTTIEKRKKKFAPSHKYAKLLGCTRLLFVIIGSNFFCHAGLVQPFVDQLKLPNESSYDTLNRLNVIFKKWLIDGKIDDTNRIAVPAISIDKNSILWTRLLGQMKANLSSDAIECQKHVNPIMKMLDINSMIVGHTPQIFINGDSINSTCQKQLWRIDNALSHAFDDIIHGITKNTKKRKTQILEIIDDVYYKILSE